MTKKEQPGDDDFYPPEVIKARMETMMRACAGIPPATPEEAELRRQMADEMDRGLEERTWKKGMKRKRGTA